MVADAGVFQEASGLRNAGISFTLGKWRRDATLAVCRETRQLPWNAGLRGVIAHDPRVRNLAYGMAVLESRSPGLFEFLWFGLKQAWACLFGALLLLGIMVTRVWYPDVPLA